MFFINCLLEIVNFYLFSSSSCPYLHRVAGDVERRYHLRYYKTSPCVYETDTRGYCVKNGPHCAFAHGPHDLRQPVYDIRELQIMEQEEKDGDSSKLIVPEDPRWNGMSLFGFTYYRNLLPRTYYGQSRFCFSTNEFYFSSSRTLCYNVLVQLKVFILNIGIIILWCRYIMMVLLLYLVLYHTSSRHAVHYQSPQIFVFVPEVFVFPVRISLSYVELYISITYKLFNGYPFGNAIRNFSSHCFEKLHVNVIF